MTKTLIALAVALSLTATACGDDEDSAAVGDEPTDGAVVDGPTGSADDGDTADDGATDDEGATDDGGTDDGLPLGAGPYPIADLTVTYQLGEDDEPVTFRLACLGDTATRTDPNSDDGGVAADAQCLALNDESVRARLLEPVPTDVLCTQQYGGPQIASITGTLDGAEVDATFHRADGCGIADWDLMGAILPAVS